MSEKTFKIVMRSIGFYVVMAVIFFGPATVQSERARDEYQARCRAERAFDVEALRWCQMGGPSVSDGAPKAMFWPLWLSYMAASR